MVKDSTKIDKGSIRGRSNREWIFSGSSVHFNKKVDFTVIKLCCLREEGEQRAGKEKQVMC